MTALLHRIQDWRVRRLATRIYMARLTHCGYADTRYALDAAAHLIGVTRG